MTGMMCCSVSPELAAWCGKSAISRPEVSKFFFAYIKENGLQVRS